MRYNRGMQLAVKRLRQYAKLPARAHPTDAGLDLFAVEACRIEPGRRATVGTGIAIELPAGTEGQIRPRSGLARNHGVTVLNAPGTIDSGYRGEIGVILINHGSLPFVVSTGDRIAQLVVAPVFKASVLEVDSLSESPRNTGGFGSTGK